jgi:hypothetical protein
MSHVGAWLQPKPKVKSHSAPDMKVHEPEQDRALKYVREGREGLYVREELVEGVGVFDKPQVGQTALGIWADCLDEWTDGGEEALRLREKGSQRCEDVHAHHYLRWCVVEVRIRECAWRRPYARGQHHVLPVGYECSASSVRRACGKANTLIILVT